MYQSIFLRVLLLNVSKSTKPSPSSFAQLMGDVQPLHKDKQQAKHQTQLTSTNQGRSTHHKTSAAKRRSAAEGITDPFDANLPSVAPEAFIEYCQPGLNPHTFRRLLQGQYRPGLTLDLHGLMVKQAYQATWHAVNRGPGCLLLIHGKARHQQDANERIHTGAHLKSCINHWLPQWPQVLAFCSARPRDGGTGAVYVMLDG